MTPHKGHDQIGSSDTHRKHSAPLRTILSFTGCGLSYFEITDNLRWRERQGWQGLFSKQPPKPHPILSMGTTPTKLMLLGLGLEEDGAQLLKGHLRMLLSPGGACDFCLLLQGCLSPFNDALGRGPWNCLGLRSGRISRVISYDLKLPEIPAAHFLSQGGTLLETVFFQQFWRTFRGFPAFHEHSAPAYLALPDPRASGRGQLEESRF